MRSTLNYELVEYKIETKQNTRKKIIQAIDICGKINYMLKREGDLYFINVVSAVAPLLVLAMVQSKHVFILRYDELG